MFKLALIKKCMSEQAVLLPKLFSLGNHFGKRTAWSLLQFLSYAYSDI
jgi:hypothetical protein